MPWFVYMVRCADASLYVGHTQDLERRVATHNAGKGADYTAKRRPVQLAYCEPYDSQSAAVAREHQLKKWSAAKKEALLRGDFTCLHDLAKRRN